MVFKGAIIGGSLATVTPGKIEHIDHDKSGNVIVVVIDRIGTFEAPPD